MSDPVTLDDIYALFQRSQEEADRRFAEADRRAAESKAEFDRRIAEAERLAAESKAAFDKRMAESKAEYDKRIAKSEAIAAQANRAVNSLSSRWGRFVENIVAPAALRLFQEQGMAVQEVYQRVRSARDKRNLEIDILVVDDDVAVVIEVKSRLTQDSIRQVLRSLEQFKLAFPHYAGYRLYGAVAAIEIDKDMDTYAYNQGLFLIQQSGDSVSISNTPDFAPRIW
ncbi:MAG: DUF3782 domain-containing protein [Cyanobacteria bacterium P01_H01_bin.105]